MINLTNSQEEYLKVIYILKNTQKDIRVTDIAKKLDKSKASVNNAINLLKNDGMIDYEPYEQSRLNEESERETIKRSWVYDMVKLC